VNGGAAVELDGWDGEQGPLFGLAITFSKDVVLRKTGSSVFLPRIFPDRERLEQRESEEKVSTPPDPNMGTCGRAP
jgi:hypothetical protein